MIFGNDFAIKNQHGTNIRTEQEFEDFNLKTEVRVPKGGNSGMYLRGIVSEANGAIPVPVEKKNSRFPGVRAS